LWWTLRRPFRPLAYHAARAMFTRAGAALGGRWRLHDYADTCLMPTSGRSACSAVVSGLKMSA
jgi:hypothetical protein